MIVRILMFFPAAVLACVLVDAMRTGEIGLNGRAATRKRNPLAYWFTFALGCFMLYWVGFRWWIFRK